MTASEKFRKYYKEPALTRFDNGGEINYTVSIDRKDKTDGFFASEKVSLTDEKNIEEISRIAMRLTHIVVLKGFTEIHDLP